MAAYRFLTTWLPDTPREEWRVETTQPWMNASLGVRLLAAG